jgi:transcription elongation factor Elf1
MPELYLRGSLANVTMANLTTDEKEHVEVIVDYVATHPGMARHRAGVIEELGNTIGADYQSDKRCGDAEFQIAIWKATVELYYHRKYTFRCKACGSNTWITQQGVERELNRQKLDCHNCKQVRVTEACDTNFKADSYVSFDEFQESYKYFTPVQNAPKCESPIEYFAGEKKYEDPDKIINDDTQLVKFFGEFVWNYFRQQLAENGRKEHKKEPRKVVGRADEVIVQEILSLCQRMKIDHNYCQRDQPQNGRYTIAVVGLLTPPEFTAEFAVLHEKARNHNVVIECNESEIQVVENSNAKSIEALISKPEHVLVLDNSTKSGGENDDGGFTISQISFRTIGAYKMDQDDHIATIDATDVMLAVRESLPDGDCKKIFDIQCGIGETYGTYSIEFGDDKPKKNHIARFLGITARSVTIYMENIRTICLAHGLVPKN